MLLSLEKLNTFKTSQDSLDFEQEIMPLEKKAAKDLVDILEGAYKKTVSLNIPKEQKKEKNIDGDEVNLINRKNNIKEFAPEPVDFAYERAIGENDSVYSNFVDLIVEAKKKVGRISLVKDRVLDGYATGFMVSETLMLTNWHVLSTSDDAVNSTIEFNYELDTKGNLKQSRTFALNPDVFFHSNKQLDFALVAVSSIDLTGKYKLSDVGYLYLSPLSGKLGDKGKESLNIIHHPDGAPMQLSLRENKFVSIKSNAIWYRSDTSQGSSGSPVFNDQWQVVALHHMGIAKKDSQGNYLDINGNAILEDANNRIDISKIHWIANEGIRISVIRDKLRETFPNSLLIDEVLNNNNYNSEKQRGDDIPSTVENIVNQGDDVNISIPSSLFKTQQAITFEIRSQKIDGLASETEELIQTDLLERESLRLERSMDYNDCRGYIPHFLGRSEKSIGIPKPKDSIKHRVANIIDSNAYILKYHKFSVIFDTTHKMPLISAINIEGDERKRMDLTKRKDKWIRDTRINLANQLDKHFYKGSGFDKGHMTRREDANWGNTAEDAKRNADLTCVYTNACPQVPSLNRSGLWGKLEKIILEKGAIKENGETGRISVFTGPIFKEIDPVYKGVSIPMEFYKIILWLSDDSNIRATAFKLSQTDLVESIDFEEIGINRNIEFKEYQVTISQIEEDTDIDFSEIAPFDTFLEGSPELEIRHEDHFLEVLNLKK